MRRRPATQTGMTLLEVILALAISSLTILMATTALSVASGYLKRQQQHDGAKQAMEDAFKLLQYELSFMRTLNAVSSKKIEFDTVLLHQKNGYQMPGRSIFECTESHDRRIELIHRSFPLVEYSSDKQKFLPNIVDATAVQAHSRVLISGLNSCAFEYGLAEAASLPNSKPGEWLSHWNQQPKDVRLVRFRLGTRQNTWPSGVFELNSHAY